MTEPAIKGYMTRAKAIEILQDLLTDGPQFPPDDRRNAVQFAINDMQTIDRRKPVKLDPRD